MLATLAGEYTKAQRWERVGTRWEEARSLALSCQSKWHQMVALGDLTLRCADAHLWELSLETWNLAEACWQEALARKEATYEVEESARRLGVLIPLCRYLVRGHQWEQACKLCQRIEEVPMRIRLGSKIATELEHLQHSADALTVWTQTSELALSTTLPSELDLSELAGVLEKARRYEEAKLVWGAMMKSVLEANQEDFSLRAHNCGWLAFEMAEQQHREEAEFLLNESMKAAIVLWGHRLRGKGLTYVDL